MTENEYNKLRRTIACNFYIIREFYKRVNPKNRIGDFYNQRDDNGNPITPARQHWAEIVGENIWYLFYLDSKTNEYILDERKTIRALSTKLGISEDVITGKKNLTEDFYDLLKTDDKYSELYNTLYNYSIYKQSENKKSTDNSPENKKGKKSEKEQFIPAIEIAINYYRKQGDDISKLNKNKPLDCLFYFAKYNKSLQEKDTQLRYLKNMLKAINDEQLLACKDEKLLIDIGKEIKRIYPTIDTILKYRNLFNPIKKVNPKVNDKRDNKDNSKDAYKEDNSKVDKKNNAD